MKKTKITKAYAIAVLKSLDYRKTKYNVVNQRIEELKLYERVVPTLNAIRKEDLRKEAIKDTKDKSLEDYINYHENALKTLENDLNRISKVIDTISKVDNICATILYLVYFQHKSKVYCSEYLHINRDKAYEKHDEAIELFCKLYH